MPDADTWLVASQMYSINDVLRRFPAGLARRVVVCRYGACVPDMLILIVST